MVVGSNLANVNLWEVLMAYLVQNIRQDVEKEAKEARGYSDCTNVILTKINFPANGCL